MQNMKQTLRVLLKNKKTTLLLLITLSIGLSAFILITAKVTFNRTYDTYLDNYKNIYRIVSSTYTNNTLTIREPRTQRVLGQILKEKYPEVIASGFLCKPEDNNYKIGDYSFTNENSFYCSNEMINIFKLKILQGKSETILTEPDRVIVSQSFAKKIFKDENPIGKIIQQNNGVNYEIESVYKDFPKNAHIAPDFLISFHNDMFLPPPLKENWGWVRFYTYLELDDNTDIQQLEDKITKLYYENNKTQAGNSESECKFHLQALSDIHTNSNYKNDIAKTVKGQYLSILQLIGIFILIISGFNYIYFSYARLSVKAPQYGIKKVLGASNKLLLSQFLFESFFIHVISVVVSFWSIFFLQRITGIIGGDITYSDLSLRFWIYFIMLFLASAIVNPLGVMILVIRKSSLDFLSRKISKIHKPFSFQQLFTVTQFTIIVFLMATILGINKQVNFLKNKDKGMVISNKLVIKTPNNQRRTGYIAKNLSSFEQEISKIAGIKSVAVSEKVPGDIPTFTFSVSEHKGVNGIKTALFIAGNEFMKSYNISTIKGEGFEAEKGNGCMINTTCMRQLGYNKPEDVIGKKIYLQDESMMQTIEASICGVCKDFNFMNTKEVPGPFLFIDWTKEFVLGNYTLSVNSQVNKKELLAKADTIFKDAFPNYPFNYFWVEDYYNKQFDDEIAIIRSLKSFALLSVLLGILSLLSMVTQICLAKTKEIGIRKVNGAKRSEVLSLLNFEFAKWIGLACLIAIPLSWFFIFNWLKSFSYKTNIGIGIFLISAGAAFVIGILTVTIQSLKTSNMNPIDSIKYE